MKGFRWLLLIFLLTACQPATDISIKQLSQNTSMYLGQSFKITGTADSQYPLGCAYDDIVVSETLIDNAGNYVFMHFRTYPSHSPGQILTITGKVDSGKMVKNGNGTCYVFVQS